MKEKLDFEHYDDYNAEAASLNLSCHVYKRKGIVAKYIDWIKSEIKRITSESKEPKQQ